MIKFLFLLVEFYEQHASLLGLESNPVLDRIREDTCLMAILNRVIKVYHNVELLENIFEYLNNHVEAD